jgi:hypothetical protein
VPTADIGGQGSGVKEAFYLRSFQISAASFQSLPIFSYTTTHLPVTFCGVGALVLTEGFDFRAPWSHALLRRAERRAPLVPGPRRIKPTSVA